jgi:hypothetical protein
MTSTPVSLFERRAIQAPIAACLIRAYAAAIGAEEALRVATDAIQADAKSSGTAVARALGGNGMEELARVAREMWAGDGALELSFIREDPRELRFDVTRCRFAELYDELGIKDLGYCLSCCRDETFIAGFNPSITLTRTRTIMEGAPVCDFCFTLRT